MTGPPFLEMERVAVMRGERLVIEDFSLRIEAGEHVVLLGPNGCGKSTFIKLLTRELYPLARKNPRVAIFGRELWHVEQLRQELGIVTNDLMAMCTRDITGEEAVLSGFFSSIGVWPWHEVTQAMREKARSLLELLEAPHLETRMVSEMSSGEARRILIARALVHDPKALLFDEPSNSLDLHAQRELRMLMRKLSQAGLTLLLVTHHVDDIIPEVERVILMRAGRVAADGPKRLVLTEAALSGLFGAPLRLVERDGYYHLW